jgi:hypothetical protein
MARKPVPQNIKDTVRISDYSDLELMEALHDLNGNGNGAKTEDMSKRLFGATVKNSEILIYANMCVTSRMAWMTRFGFVEKVSKGVWRLTDIGEDLRSARLPTAFAQRIISSKDSDALQLARQVGIRILMTKQNDVVFRAMERQLRYNIVQRKRA